VLAEGGFVRQAANVAPMATGPRRALSVAALALGALVAPAHAADATGPTLGQLVGQHILIRMSGTVPSSGLLARIRSGQIGGVILFGNNIPRGGPPVLVRQLQAAARAGRQLPLLIAIDQEGGAIKRLPGPPTKAPSEMRSTGEALAQGRATGRYLHGLGIGIDLAPVVDVPSAPSSFIASRTFSTDPAVVAARGTAFGQGLVQGGVASTAKHFPGLGRLYGNTDLRPGRIPASRVALERDLVPFRAAIRAGTPTVMVGTAAYLAYSPLPAATSPEIVTGLLRGQLGFRGVTLSDDLATKGVGPWFDPGEATVRAVRAGIDMVYVAGVGGSGGVTVGEEAYTALLGAARAGTISRVALQASYDRIASLKARYS
jgi:beta-N-acetylhexosaminidase